MHSADTHASSHRIGIDLGGTKIAGVIFSPDGELLDHLRAATPRDDYEGTVAAVADMVARLKTAAGRQADTTSVGVGMPGSPSPTTGLIRNANSTWLIGKPFQQDLTTALGQEVRLENDANCLVLSEAVDGAAAGHSCVFGVILGTGVGGGIVVDGKVLSGRNLIAGEWGHNPLPQPRVLEDPAPPPCYCGRVGCIETYLSGPGLSLDHKRHTGDALTGPEIVRLSEATKEHASPAADQTVRRYIARLGSALARVVNLLDPDVIVLGGGLSRWERLYQDLPDAMAPHVFSDQWSTPVVPALHGDDSGVRGAAWLWP